MFEFLLVAFVLWLVYSRISSVKRELHEKIDDLEHNVSHLQDKIGSLQKQLRNISAQEKSSESADVRSTPDKAVVKPETANRPTVKPSPKIDLGVKPPVLAKNQQDLPPDPEISRESDFSSLKFSQPVKPADDIESISRARADQKYEWLKASQTEKFAGESDDGIEKAATQKNSSEDDIEAQKTSPKRKYSADTPPGGSGAGGTGGGGPDEPRGPDQPDDPDEPSWGERWSSFVSNVDWEKFTGANLFAWLGGLALFIGAGFFVKYSIDKNLISPILRLVIGAIVGLGMIGASCWFERGRYDTMRQTFAAGGIGVLYSVFFAATLYYGYLPKPAGFATLVVVSAAAFVLALFHRGIAISVLGGVGAYLTPLLVTTGTGSLITLFVYLTIVNIGLFQVMIRLNSSLLMPFAAIGTMLSLACGTFFPYPTPEAMMIAWAWIGNLLAFTIFIDRSGFDPQESRSAWWSAILTFLSLPFMALIVTLGKAGSAPMAMLAAAVTFSFILAIRNKGWTNLVVPYSSMTFVVAAIWTFSRFNHHSSIWAFLAFFIYGLAGGAGPVILIHKNGFNRQILTWLKGFPVAVSLLMLMVIILTPQMSYLFWPMAIGLQVVGIIVSMLFGGLLQLAFMAIILVTAGVIWLEAMSPIVAGASIYGMLLFAGAVTILVIFWCLKRAVRWSSSLVSEDPANVEMKLTSAQTEWMSATPVMGIFALLATTFAFVQPLNPNPGMVTLLCLGAITLTMARRMKFSRMIAVTLFSAAFAQGFWALRSDLTSVLYLHSMLWSGAFFAAALVVPFLVYRCYSTFKIAWMAWPIYELAQAIFLVYAADHFWGRDIAGWVPFLLAFIKLPVVAHLLRQLHCLPERNSIIACHGGVLLFYVSTTPILLLEKGWIGLVLVLEAVALLWLNRRVEHSGLRRVSTIMAPIGLYMLLSFLPQMKGPQSIIILNSAVMSVLAATLALFAAVKLAPVHDESSGRFNLPRYFLWLAVGTGFYLVNLMVADVFAGSLVTTGATIKFRAAGDLLQQIMYMFLWALFGAVLWRRQDLPTGIRVFGMILVILSVLWLIAFPFNYGSYVATMAPLVNLGLLAFIPIMVILLYLFLKEPWGESSISIKNLFLAMLLITGFLAIKVIKSTILQPGLPLDIFMDKTAAMAVGSAAGWIIYGLAMLAWPRRLDRPFRLAGLILMTLGIGKALAFPFRYAAEFGAMQPLLNRPTVLFAFCIGVLIWLTRRKYDDSWPVSGMQPNNLFATMLAIVMFCFMNIEIASVFGHEGRPFSLLTRGSLAHQLGYSLSWLIFAIGLLVCGIKWNVVKARQAALVLILVTCFKIFLKDLWALGQLYRVASFIGLAIVLMLVSYLYQRFLTNSGDNANEKK